MTHFASSPNNRLSAGTHLDGLDAGAHFAFPLLPPPPPPKTREHAGTHLDGLDAGAGGIHQQRISRTPTKQSQNEFFLLTVTL